MIAVHAGFAMVTSTPEWNLEPAEATEYAKAAQSVARHYNISVSAQAYDHTVLLSVAGSIYFRRFQYFAERRRAMRQAPPGTNGAAPQQAGNGYAPPMGTELPEELLATLRTDMDPN